MNSKKEQIAIVGGGASGLAAAIEAARAGAKVCIFEKSTRLGKTILKTGNGRCNLSNLNISADEAENPSFYAKDFHCNKGALAKYNNPQFVAPVLAAHDSTFIQNWFESMGLLLRTDDEGRIFPACNSAAVVRDVLEAEISRLGVEVHCNTEIDSIEFSDNKAKISATELVPKNTSKTNNVAKTSSVLKTENASEPKQIQKSFDVVIIATGGGSSLLKSCGHNIEPFSPRLCGVACDKKLLKGLNNVRVKCLVSAFHASAQKCCAQWRTPHAQNQTSAEAPFAQEFGEILFRDYGLSGIVILNMSRLVEKDDVLSLDLLPNKSMEEVINLLQQNARHINQNAQHATQCSNQRNEQGVAQHINQGGRQYDNQRVKQHAKQTENPNNPVQFQDIMRGIFVPQLNNAILQRAGFNSKQKLTSDNTEKQSEVFAKIAYAIKNFNFDVRGSANENFAQVTRGGASIDEFDPQTMRSKFHDKLYACGEALDIDAACGGYNLHWAWASGIVAGQSASTAATS